VARVAPGRHDDPDFSASLEDWSAFFAGRVTAGMALLRFTIRVRGPVRRVLPYTAGFNSFAPAARAATEPFRHLWHL
jgi:hypothetical protein